jgi:hypothetical protein
LIYSKTINVPLLLCYKADEQDFQSCFSWCAPGICYLNYIDLPNTLLAATIIWAGLIWGCKQLNNYDAAVPAFRWYSATKPMHKASAGYSLLSGSLELINSI